ncbi:MAG: carbon-nitrogen hydrolase family protein [Propionibacteriales bacterium]|nr:carbon-nitrogen hydrolase family protein [Propionibacteriales bacterium]
MSEDRFPTLRVAAVQAAPVFLDREATFAKLEQLVAEAAGQGAELVAFGESFLPGFPIWNGVLAPVDQHPFFERLVRAAIAVPGPDCDRLGALARRHRVMLSVGVNERSNAGVGTLWNTNLVFDPDGRLVNHRRKLVPTWYERLTWAAGDGAGLDVVDLRGGQVGVLICGENTNTLARFALLAAGEQVHIATYPPTWPFDREPAREYDLTDAIRIRSAAHSFEGKVFTIVAATALDDDALAQVAGEDDETRRLLTGGAFPASMIVGPSGNIIAGPLVGEEGILIAEVDLAESIRLKQIHDIVGTYNRFDVFSLMVERRRLEPVHFHDAGAPGAADHVRPATRWPSSAQPGHVSPNDEGTPTDDEST